MTISTTGNSKEYVGDGVSTAFAFPYPFITTGDLKFYLKGIAQTTGFSVTGIGTADGGGTFQSGTLTVNVPPAIGDDVLIYCDPDLLQSTALPPNDPFPSKTVEKALDKLTLLIQRIYGKFGNAITFPSGDTTSGTLPGPAARANTALVFDGAGVPRVAANLGPGNFQFGVPYIDQFVPNGGSAYTLSANPGLLKNLHVSVGGVEQGNGIDYTWSPAAPLVLTSSSIWPPDVIVQVSYTQAIPISAVNASLVNFGQVGGIGRTLLETGRERRSVLDFGLAAAMALGGGTFLVPAGAYAYTSGLVADYSSDTFPGYPIASKRVSLVGDSMSNTFLNYGGAAGTYALTLNGPATFAHEGVYSASKYSNLTLEDAGATNTRNGISVTNLTDVELEDLTLYRFAIGIYWNSSLSSRLTNVKFRYCTQGMVLDSTTGQSNPNALTFDNCDWTACVHQGIVANVMGSTNRFSSCRFEANGVQGQSTNGGAEFTIQTGNGPASMLFESCYFEGNAGSYDVFLTNAGSQDATVIFKGCTFNRVSSSSYVTTNVGAGNTGGAALRVIFIGCSFFSAGTYVPNASRPFFSASDNKVLFIDGGGNVFSENTSRVTSFFNNGGRVNGATGAILVGAAPFSCVRNSAGNYTITSSVPLGPTTNDISVAVATLSSLALSATVQVLTSNTLTVITRVMNTGTATDCDFSFNFTGLKG